MPELGEVEHATVLWRKYLVGHKITHATVSDDSIVIVQPLTPSVLEGFLVGKTVSHVTRHGKYFWLRFEQSSQVLLLHFGMAGWVKVKGVETHFLMMENGGDVKAKKRIQDTESAASAKRRKTSAVAVKHEHVPEHLQQEHVPEGTNGAGVRAAPKQETGKQDLCEEWPPKYCKFVITLDDGTQAAFTDVRRLGRIRLVHAPTDADLFKVEPLLRSGPDYSRADLRPTLAEFTSLLARKAVPVKSLLLDQAFFAGVGNWVADEILYHARMHPEQVAKTVGPTDAEALYTAVCKICSFVVDVEGNTQRFPKDWLMLHRWGKARKAKQTTHDGHAVAHVSVGGRTSCYVPALQKKRALP